MDVPSFEILVVEDNALVRKVICQLLKKANYTTTDVCCAEDAITEMNQHYFDLVISDYKMESMSGLELLKYIKRNWPATEVIIVTAYGTIEHGVKAIKLGASDYITKPFDNARLLELVGRFVEEKVTGEKQDKMFSKLRALTEFDSIIGESSEIINLMDLVHRIASKNSTVLISGESGTGKELVTQAIHALSDRKDKPFVAINCGAIPENLQESELFGYVKGAFTGADSDKKGILEYAEGGTVFLDEIGDMGFSTQVKLLRAIQENEIRRVGDTKVRTVNFRLIVATNKVLDEEIKNGRFREDLYYRINVIPINIPPLRNRKKDIPLLVEHFLKKYNYHNQDPIKRLSKRTKSMLMNYEWPGNVRELENVIHRGVALATTEEITSDLLPEQIQNHKKNNTTEKSQGNLAEIEKKVILETLERMQGSKVKTARELGISKSTLWRKLKY